MNAPSAKSFAAIWSHGDVAVKSSDIGSENSCFSTSHYHGISIFIETDKFSDELLAIMKTLSIDLNRVKALTENENSLFMLRKSEAADHIFSELYTVRENHRAGYLKLKILELLLFLTDIDIGGTIYTEHFKKTNRTSRNILKKQ